jgi:hypothetical protein
MPETKTVKIPRFLGKVLGMEEVPTAVEPEAPAQADDSKNGSAPKSSTRHEAPSLPGRKPASGIPSGGAPASEASSDAAVRGLTEQLIADALASVPEKFKEFLRQRESSLEVLNGTLTGDVLMAKAIALAAKAAKISANDVKSAFGAARTCVASKRADFAEALKKERAEQVDQPTSKIADTQNEMAEIAAQIHNLEKRKSELESSIGPARQAIAEAEAQLKEGQTTFERATAAAEASLQSLEMQLSQFTKGGK